MRRSRLWILLAVAVLPMLAALYAYGSDGTSARDLARRHSLATLLQIVAPLIAGIGCWTATRSYSSGDRERLVWGTGAAAALAWVIGRIVFAAYQQWGHRTLPYPSLADGFFVAFYLLLAIALAMEVRLVLPMVDGPARAVLVAMGILGWIVSYAYVLHPIVTSASAPTQKILAAFYPSAAVFLVPAGLTPALGFRGGVSAYPWLVVAASALCLAAASLGYALLTSYNLYSDVHTVNVLWVAGFTCLAIGGFWQRAVQEEV